MGDNIKVVTKDFYSTKKRNKREINFYTPENAIKVVAKAKGGIFSGKMPNGYGVVDLIPPVLNILKQKCFGC